MSLECLNPILRILFSEQSGALYDDLILYILDRIYT